MRWIDKVVDMVPTKAKPPSTAKHFALIIAALIIVIRTLVCGGPAGWAAERTEPKPLAVLSFAGIGELESDIAYLGKLAGNPGLATDFDAALNRATGGAGLAGVDKSRPWGAVLQTDDGQPTIWLFLPVTNPEKFLTVLEPQLGKPRKLADDLWEFSLGPEGTPVFMLFKGDWGFVAQRRNVFAAVPGNPASLLGTLPRQYDLAIRLMPGKLSAAQLNGVFEQIGQFLDSLVQQPNGSSDVQSALRRQVVRRTTQLLAALAAELEQVVLGFSLDQGSGRAQLDLVFNAKPGSQLARQFAELRSSRTNFAGFGSSGAALTGIWAGRLPEAKAAALEALLDDMRSIVLHQVALADFPEEDRKTARTAVNQFFAVFQQTVRQRQVDGGMIGVLNPEAATLAVGLGLSETEKLEDVSKLAADLVRKHRPEYAAWIKLQAQRHRGVNFHTIQVPIPTSGADSHKLTALFGESIELAVGIGRQALYFAAGRDALETLKQAIDRSAENEGKLVPPVELSLRLGPVAETVAVLGPAGQRALAELIAKELKKISGGDQLNLLVTPTAFGVRYRLEAEEGLLRLLARMTNIKAEEIK